MAAASESKDASFPPRQLPLGLVKPGKGPSTLLQPHDERFGVRHTNTSFIRDLQDAETSSMSRRDVLASVVNEYDAALVLHTSILPDAF